MSFIFDDLAPPQIIVSKDALNHFFSIPVQKTISKVLNMRFLFFFLILQFGRQVNVVAIASPPTLARLLNIACKYVSNTSYVGTESAFLHRFFLFLIAVIKCFRISRRSALAKIFKEYEKFDSALRALPSDKEAEERSNKIRNFCSLAKSGRGMIPDDKNLQLYRHNNLVASYEKMVMKELASGNFVNSWNKLWEHG